MRFSTHAIHGPVAISRRREHASKDENGPLYVTSPDILQRLDRLDKSSPQFPNQLTNLLHEKRYELHISKLQDQDAVWLIEYLDNVCLYTALHPLTTQPG